MTGKAHRNVHLVCLGRRISGVEVGLALLFSVGTACVACGKAGDKGSEGSATGGMPVASVGGSSGGASGGLATGGADSVGDLPESMAGAFPMGGQPEPWTWERIQETARSAPTPVNGAARPRSPDFEPSLVPLGEPGWRDSKGTPFCHSLRFPTVPSLWASGHGVAVLTRGECDSALDSPSFECSTLPIEERETGTDIRYNDGTGWRWIYGHPKALGGLSGIGDGTLVVSADEVGVAKLSLDGELTTVVSGVPGQYFSQVIGLSSGSMRVVVGDANDQFLYAIDGDSVVPLYSWPGNTSTAWFAGDDNVTYVYKDEQFLVRRNGSEPQLLPQTPLGGWTRLAVDPASGGLWAVQTNLVAHFDGDEWSVVGELPGEPRGIAAAGSDLYIVTWSHFLRATRSKVSTLVETYDFFFTAITASPSGEIFVAARDKATMDDQCSGDFVAYWDGTEFHLF
jgi:hypothetical protein